MDPRIKRLYWQVTALLLAAHFAGWADGLPLAIALTAGQVLHFSAFRCTLRALDVQVRIGYAGLLMLGSVGPLWPIHLVQFVGVNAMLVADYCLLARLIVLMPWNRGVPLSAHLVRQALFLPPAPGAIHHRLELCSAREPSAGRDHPGQSRHHASGTLPAVEPEGFVPDPSEHAARAGAAAVDQRARAAAVSTSASSR